MKFIVDTFKEFGFMIACCLYFFCVCFISILLVMLPFLVPMYVNSLLEYDLPVHWILTLIIATFFVEFAIARAVEGDC